MEGALRVFRNRLTPQQAIDFARIIPSELRTLFIADWQLDQPVLPPGSGKDWVEEAQRLRRNHNIAPDGCVEGAGLALHKSVQSGDLGRALAWLPAFASEFWRVLGVDPKPLGSRIF